MARPAKGHTYGEWKVTKTVTCTEDGLEERVCSVCNYVDSKTITAIGHNPVLVAAQDPTCTEAGWNEHHACNNVIDGKVCGFTEDKVDRPALGHDWSEWTTIKSATCTEDGYQVKICARCQLESEEKNVLTALGHELIDVAAKDPTCTEAGNVAYKKCIREGCTYTDPENYVIDALGHKYEAKDGKAATCTEDGYSAYEECSICHDVKGKVEEKATGHDWQVTETVEAKCETETDGYIDYKCSVCNETKHEVIKFAHTPVVTSNYDKVKCGEQYTTKTICSACGKVISEEATLTKEHVAGEWRVTTEATCEKAGLEELYCKNCGNAYDSRVIPAEGHIWNAESKAATCTEAGYTKEVCSKCTKEQNVVVLPALGHNFVDGICSRCGASEKEYQVLTAEEYFTTNDGETYTFGNAKNVTAEYVTVPATFNGKPVVAIADKAFQSNKKLKGVIISEGITTVGMAAFQGCTNLETVAFADSITSIGAKAFAQCTSLKSIVLPENLKSIEGVAFYNCSGLVHIELSNKLTSISDTAFDLSAIKTVTFNGTADEWNKLVAKIDVLKNAEVSFRS